MVVFTCTHCGDSLQKPKVEKHYQTACRSMKSLTCVDCLKDFRGEEYAAHTKCITEEERYAAKGVNHKSVVKKGEVKQESWTELVKAVVDNLGEVPSGQRRVFDVIADSVNVPRKKNKFTNFIKSSTGGRIKDADIEGVWNTIEQYKSAQNQNGNVTSTDETEMLQKPDDKKKRKSKEVDVLDQGETETKTNDSVTSTNDTEKVSKKKRKSKVLPEPDQAEVEPNQVDAANTSETVKKSKKQRKSEDVPITPNSNIIPENGSTSKKKRKSSENTLNSTTENSKTNDAETPQKKRKTKKLNEPEPLLNATDEPPPTMTNISPHKKPKPNSDEPEHIKGKTVNDMTDEAPSDASTFDYKQQILKIFNSKDSISIEKLQKKVLKAFTKKTGIDASKKVIKKFNKKLKKMTEIEIKDNKVSLISKA